MVFILNGYRNYFYTLLDNYVEYYPIKFKLLLNNY